MNPTKREEHEIFRELAGLCATSGYAHVIANLCFRDNVIKFAGELTPDDAQHLYSRSRLIRTEMSTLIGLMAQHPIDLALPPPEIVRELTKRTEQLLEELHDSLSGKMFSSVFDGATAGSEATSPFQGELLREPIFYGGESAYSFQYRDLAALKYLQATPG